MKSMTGYGAGSATTQDGTTATVEISSVNSKKQVDMRISLPKELLSMDSDIRNLIQKKLVRGTLGVQVSYKLSPQAAVAAAPIDENLAMVAAERLKALAESCGMPAPTMKEVLMVPGVLQINDKTLDSVRPLVMEALSKAIDELEASRSREGVALHDELKSRGDAIATLVAKIESMEQEAIVRYRDKLVERIAKLGVEIPVDDEKIAREVAFYVDKSDITEETVRLKSHLVQYYSLLEGGDDVGRNLDFLGQEMAREANTLSVKATDIGIGEHALALKIEISKIKEQIMNVQ